MDTAWYEDPIFDDTAEVVDGAFVQGDDWRRLQYCKDEAGGEGEVVKVRRTRPAPCAPSWQGVRPSSPSPKIPTTRKHSVSRWTAPRSATCQEGRRSL